jgi:hypothetical protein
VIAAVVGLVARQVETEKGEVAVETWKTIYGEENPI